jgi:uncharacterized protein (TIGR03437 family)
MKSLAMKSALGCLLAMPLLAQAQTTPPTCSESSLTGTYYLVLTGRNVNSSTALSASYEAVGSATFDGLGHVTFLLTANTNLLQGVLQQPAGTYNPGPNCVGTLNITVGDSAAYTLIIFNQGKNFTITGQDATYDLTGTGGQQPVSCPASLLSGTYAFNGTGFTLSSTAISGVNSISGLLQFDGRGGLTGNWSIATSGAATPDTVAGSYSMNADCQATATVKDPSGASWALAFTMTSAAGTDFSVDASNLLMEFSASGHSTFTNPGLAVANLASSVGNGTPAGSLFALYGVDLAPGSASSPAIPLSNSLLSTTVTINGEEAPLNFVDQTQINGQMPWDIKPGVANVVVTTASGMSNTVAVTVPATGVPGIFPQFPGNQAVADVYPKSDGFTTYFLNTPSTPAHVGDIVTVYFTGGGPVTPTAPLVTGAGSPLGVSPVTETANTGVTLAGVQASVSYMGLTGTLVGIYQANFVVPQVAAGARKLVITIGGQASVAAIFSVAD